jgi:myo-inositol-1(or 4)-monophosphatase
MSQPQSLQDALISLSVSIKPERRPLTLSTLVRLLPEIQDFRRTGSTACDLLAVATGGLDAYIGIGTNDWDIAAGWALVNAAGGVCQRFRVSGGQEAFVIGTPGIAEQLKVIVTDHARLFVANQAVRDQRIGPAARHADDVRPSPLSSGESPGRPRTERAR